MTVFFDQLKKLSPASTIQGSLTGDKTKRLQAEVSLNSGNNIVLYNVTDELTVEF